MKSNIFLSKIWMLALVLAVGSSACKKDDPEPDPVPDSPDLISLATQTQNGITLEILAKDSFFVGYNELYLQLTDDQGNKLTTADIFLLPEMDMGSMQHACPVENPTGTADPNNFDLFKGAVIFQMGSMGMMSWKLDVDVEIGRTMHHYSFDPIEVRELDDTRARVFMSASNAKLICSWMYPMNPEIGINDLGLTLHRMNGPFDFTAVEDYTVEIEPWMPSMGHGSPNNVNPIHIGDGHYDGKVNFTMTGHWEVMITLKDAQGVIETDDLFFDVRF